VRKTNIKIGDYVFITTTQKKGIVNSISNKRIGVDIDEPRIAYCKKDSLIQMPNLDFK
jgi:hypothetical protein